MERVFQTSAFGAKVSWFRGERGLVVVDAGARRSLGRIAGGLRRAGHEIKDVSLIVLTHYHPDHAGGLKELVEATVAPVAAHTSEAPAVSGMESLPSPYRHPLAAGLAAPLVRLIALRPVPVRHALAYGEPLPGAEDVVAVHAPGHTPGSLCLHLLRERALIVGDALTYRFGRLGPPASWVTQDARQALDSIAKLSDLDFDAIYFSHYPPINSGAKAAVMALVRSLGQNRGSGMYSRRG